MAAAELVVVQSMRRCSVHQACHTHTHAHAHTSATGRQSRQRGREGKSKYMLDCVRLCVFLYASACVCARLCVFIYASACVCVCVCGHRPVPVVPVT
jgi:hypothetical protein